MSKKIPERNRKDIPHKVSYSIGNYKENSEGKSYGNSQANSDRNAEAKPSEEDKKMRRMFQRNSEEKCEGNPRVNY